MVKQSGFSLYRILLAHCCHGSTFNHLPWIVLSCHPTPSSLPPQILLYYEFKIVNLLYLHSQLSIGLIAMLTCIVRIHVLQNCLPQPLQTLVYMFLPLSWRYKKKNVNMALVSAKTTFMVRFITMFKGDVIMWISCTLLILREKLLKLWKSHTS